MSSPSNTSPDFLEILRSERRDIIDRLRRTRFSTLREGYSHAQVIPHASYSPWYDDEKFISIFDVVSQSTLVDIYRCYELYSIATQLANIPGAFAEVGVWRGGTAAIVAAVFRDREVHLFDTFTGVPDADPGRDTLYRGGEHADTSEAIVEALFRRMSLRCSIHRGIFPKDTAAAIPDVIAMAHIDVDTYSSAKDAFLAFWPHVAVSGVVIFDDYGFFGCEGVTQAVHELIARASDAMFVHNLNGHAVVIKRHL